MDTPLRPLTAASVDARPRRTGAGFEVLSLLVALAVPVAAVGQGRDGPAVSVPVGGHAQVRDGARDPLARADSLMLIEGDAQAAYEFLTSAGVVGAPAEWRAARAAIALGVLHGSDGPARDRWLDRAIQHGNRAVAADSTDLDAWYWRVAAHGRRSLHADPGLAVDLARAVSGGASRILAVDSLHAGAHNALGRMDLEIMILPGWKRMIARTLAPDALKASAWDRAEHHLTLAVQLEPSNALYLRDLGALHLARGRPQVARVLLERLAVRTGLLPWDEVFRLEAVAMLGKLGEG